LALVPAELLDQAENQALVLAQKGAHLLAVLGLGGVGLGDGAGVEEVAVDLTVQVFPVRDDHKAIVADTLSRKILRTHRR
jgi:hypothetical protein